MRELDRQKIDEDIGYQQRFYADEREQWLEEERVKMERYRAIYGDDAIRVWNSESPGRHRRTRQEQAKMDLDVCLMPGCTQPMIHKIGQPLGVCYGHGLGIADYFEWVKEDFELKLSKLSRFESHAKRQRREERAAESRRHHPGWIYYLQVGDHIKIGFTVDVKRRLKAYPPGSRLLALHPGTKQLEHDTHTIFVGSRAAGREWFLDTDELRDHIKAVHADFGEPDRARYEHHGTGRNKSRLKAS